MSRDDDYIWKPVLWSDPLNWLIEWLWNKPRHWWAYRNNPAPSDEFERVEAGQGRTYWLRQGGELLTVWRLCYCGEEVGKANALWYEEEARLDIGDIGIVHAHRGRGLGKLLLKRVEAHARQLGASSITGRVVAMDVQAFAGLPDWYRSQGYEVNPVDVEPERGGTETVAYIRKAIG